MELDDARRRSSDSKTLSATAMSNTSAHSERRGPDPRLERAVSKLQRDMDQLKRLYTVERARLEKLSFKPADND
jgi:hypothetical protein